MVIINMILPQGVVVGSALVPMIVPGVGFQFVMHVNVLRLNASIPDNKHNGDDSMMNMDTTHLLVF